MVKKHDPVSLSCKADGTPPPKIEWYKDNELVKESFNRILLPNGDLFILNVMNNKKDKDIGIYYCLALNEHGKTRSRNATIEIACEFLRVLVFNFWWFILSLVAIRDEFKALPKNVDSVVGDDVVFECSPPRGFPEPSVQWKKNGQMVNLEGRFRLSNTNLVITNVQAQDAGSYQCVAQNYAGTRESHLAQLTVLGKIWGRTLFNLTFHCFPF